MQKILISLLCLLASSVALAEAEGQDKEGVSTAITDQIYKKHPKAAELVGEKKSHFGQELIKVYYKEGEEKFVDYFRPDGRYYVAGHLIAADDMMFADSKEKLKSAFNEYKIQDAILIVNPNGMGEEFDLVIENGGKNWNVTIDKKGNVEKTEIN
jgi:hypothetical protein